jgi:deoxyribodipyrimidine photolyase-related protein
LDAPRITGSVRTVCVVFGDQLDPDAEALASLDKARDAVVMMEVAEESTHVPSHVQRTVMFLAAMRHFAMELVGRGFRVRYVTLDDPANTGSFAGELARAAEDLQPKGAVCTVPGEWRVLETVEVWAKETGLALRVFEDRHFLCSREEFAAWARGRKALTMEFFYREMRRKTGYLLTEDGEPEGGEWNFDKENRLPFGKEGPKPRPPRPVRFEPDAVTLEVIDAVKRRLPDLYGRLEEPAAFGWPVTRAAALEGLRDFVARRLGLFGPYEDAMWTGEAFVYHSALSPALNLKLLNPRECCEAALAAYRAGKAPLRSVEAFVRQLIGWREFIRGIYWLEGPGYAVRNGLDQHGKLPDFYWTGRTDMNCLRECLGQVVSSAYGHHIQRLMVIGNFALISGVHPKAISDWFLGMYADGVDWVTLPNTLGMVMHADRRADAPRGVSGLVGTKPYAAGANYIGRMSNYCAGCRYDPKKRSGDDACPFNVFFWDFLVRTKDRFAGNQRMGMMLKNAERLSPGERAAITVSARSRRAALGIEPERSGS